MVQVALVFSMQLAFVSILVDEGRRAEFAKGKGTRKREKKKEKKRMVKGRKKRERTRLSNCEYAKRVKELFSMSRVRTKRREKKRRRKKSHEKRSK